LSLNALASESARETVLTDTPPPSADRDPGLRSTYLDRVKNSTLPKLGDNQGVQRQIQPFPLVNQRLFSHFLLQLAEGAYQICIKLKFAQLTTQIAGVQNCRRCGKPEPAVRPGRAALPSAGDREERSMTHEIQARLHSGKC